VRINSGSRSAISRTGRMKSACPVAIALRGIDPYSASSGSWTRMMPPASLTVLMPTEPSDPAPERTIAKSSPPCAASDRKKRSIGARCHRGSSNSASARCWSVTRSWRLGIDAARLETDASGHLGHRHAGSSRKDIRQFALVLGVEVDDDNKRRIDVVRQSREKHLQRMNAPCRRSDADGREALGGLFSRCFLRVRGRLTVVVHWQPSYARGGPSPGRAASDLKHRFDWLNHL
jgi:hypothetical protein